MAPAESVAREQTMDEILASIRRIIQSHDEADQQLKATGEAPAGELEAFRHALATESLPAEAELVRAPSPAPEQKAAVPAPVHAEPLVSDAQGRKVAAAFDELSAMMKRTTEKQMADRTEDMLRPMLQEWLDENLPAIVERLVREEIERIARGGI